MAIAFAMLSHPGTVVRYVSKRNIHRREDERRTQRREIDFQPNHRGIEQKVTKKPCLGRTIFKKERIHVPINVRNPFGREAVRFAFLVWVARWPPPNSAGT